MSSLLTKVNKSRSPATRKVLAKKGTKASAKKPQRPGKITATPKSKRPALAKAKPSVAKSKPSLAKSKKVATPPKKSAAKVVKSVSKNVAARKKVPTKAVRAASTPKTQRAPVSTRSKALPRKVSAKRPPPGRMAAKASRVIVKALPPPPKKPPSANALAAVRSFEQALKVFHRHVYSEARSAFETILDKFPDQAEVVAGARTYLAICEQRLGRAPAVPRDAESLYDQGVFEFNKGNTREAIELYGKALRSDPRADHVWYSLAAAYARLTDSLKALDALRRAIGIRSVHRSHARRDMDFASLRSNHDFQQLTGFGFDLMEE